jgi:hypothetical protein
MFGVSRGPELGCQRVDALPIGCGHVLESMFYDVGSGGVVIIVISFTSISSTPCLRHVLFNLRNRKLWSGRKMEYRNPFSVNGRTWNGRNSLPRTVAVMFGVS